MLLNGLLIGRYRLFLPKLRTLGPVLSVDFRRQSSFKEVVPENNYLTISARLVNSAPRSWQPYLKLSRYDKPIGSWLLFWPCSWGIASAASAGTLPSVEMLALFATGSFIMRGAGCTINDMWDRDIDAKVDRTLQRPLVNNDINMKQAWIFLAGQLSVGFAILLQLNWFSVALGASSMLLVITYPLMKRITHWPQLMLGFTFNWGALLGYSAICGSINALTCLPLYVAGISWTIIYDTIYAHQDRKDDVLLGMKSTAIHFGDKTVQWLIGFSSSMISALVLSGVMNNQGWPYYGAVGLVATHLANQLYTLDINNPQNCGQRFLSNSLVGFIIFMGIVLGTLSKKSGLDKRERHELELVECSDVVSN